MLLVPSNIASEYAVGNAQANTNRSNRSRRFLGKTLQNMIREKFQIPKNLINLILPSYVIFKTSEII